MVQRHVFCLTTSSQMLLLNDLYMHTSSSTCTAVGYLAGLLCSYR